jgi:hypothetical protein
MQQNLERMAQDTQDILVDPMRRAASLKYREYIRETLQEY